MDLFKISNLVLGVKAIVMSLYSSLERTRPEKGGEKPGGRVQELI